jgi:CxxC motif-containing protein (DUF1111 family)
VVPLLAALVTAACAGSPGELLDPQSGGAGSVAASNRNAFGQPSALLSNDERRRFEVGESFFTQNWVAAPASTQSRDGLGSLFNAQACSSCHVRDGRAAPPADVDDPNRGLLLRLSIPDAGEGATPLGEPTYGDQLQDRAIPSVDPEGTMTITHREIPGAYRDGTPYRLSEPLYELTDLAYGRLHPETLLSPRIAPQVIGSGLLEAVADADILAAADPDDADGDGISGRPNWVVGGDGQRQLGRFGWKAAVPSVADQVASAFLEDIGITNPLLGEENCPTPAEACREAPNGGSPEIDADPFDRIVFYSQTLAVPERRDLDDRDVATGSRLFAELRCTACHTATFTTANHQVAALSNQVIHPYSDLLLHDMGAGLADGRPDRSASGSEWRTPPLWGIGLVETVNGHTNFLHDGRARSIEEAILWHGGEAAAAQSGFVALDAEERAAIIAFLESL